MPQPRNELPADLILAQMAEALRRAQEADNALLDDDSPIAVVTRQFFQGSWEEAQAQLLSKTDKIVVRPYTREAPRSFDFQVAARPYKRRLGSEAPVVVCEPIRGQIHYRLDIFEDEGPQVPPAAVLLDPAQGFYHPNVSPAGHVCLGQPREEWTNPLPLKALLEYVLTILTYQNYRVFHTLNPHASQYFAYEKDAFEGLEEMAPLYA